MGKSKKQQARTKSLDKLYRLKPEALMVGDVIASTVPDDKFSKAIRFYTGGDFSHVALVVTRDILCEAADFGVLNSSPYRLIVQDPKHLAVFRPKQDRIDFPTSSEKRELLSSACADMWLAYYGMAKALGVAIPPLRLLADDHSYYCSELVARAYARAGIDVCPGILPHKTTPQMIIKSDVFVRVDPNELFEEISPAMAKDLLSMISPVDTSNSDDRLSLLQRISTEIQETRSTAKRAGSAHSAYVSPDELRKWTDTIEDQLSPWLWNRNLRQEKIRYLVTTGQTEHALRIYDEQYKFAERTFHTMRTAIETYWEKKGPTSKLPQKDRNFLQELQRSLGLQYMSMHAQWEDLEYLKKIIANGNSADIS